MRAEGIGLRVGFRVLVAYAAVPCGCRVWGVGCGVFALVALVLELDAALLPPLLCVRAFLSLSLSLSVCLSVSVSLICMCALFTLLFDLDAAYPRLGFRVIL